MNEIWKDINGYNGLYQISNLGRVKSLNKSIIKKLQTNEKGYLKVTLANNKKRKTYFVHRLVALHFIPNINNLPQINHKNENKCDNRVENLEWCDNRYNCNYGVHNTKISQKLKRHPSLIKPILQLTPNGELIKKWGSSTDAAENLHIHKTCISECCNGKQKTAGGYVWGFMDDYTKIPFKVFQLDFYTKRVG